MAKDEFDFDFDFEKEFGLDPSTFEGADKGVSFTDDELGLSASETEEFDDDFDVDSLNGLLNEEERKTDDSRAEDFDFGVSDDASFADASLDDFSDFDLEDDAAELVSRKNKEPSPVHQEPSYQEPEATAPVPEEPELPEEPEAPVEAQVQEPPQPKRERKRREPKAAKSPKRELPPIFTKFVDLYFTPIFKKEAQQEPPQVPGTRRRRKKTKMQIFKEVYLPAIVVVLCMILVMTFAVGALSSFIAQRQSDKVRQEAQIQESQSAEELAQQKLKAVLKEAEEYATVYHYSKAIEVLEDFLATVEDKAAYPEITTQRSAYVTAQSQLVEYMDPSTIPNLSFHTLMVDPARSFRDPEFGGLYNRNFISIGEFQKILDQLYNAGYVLVDFDSFTRVNGDQIFSETIYLPQGKKPVMITATMVNYWNYMIDSDGDGEPDAGGDGFANKLVLDSNGDIKASYIDSNGVENIGDYDLIPILETFIKEHPSFSYQGARATVAVAGKEGVFGYRINSSYISTKGQTYVDGEIAGAKAMAQALRDKGYDIACYTYSNWDYGKKNANQISDDLNKWKADIVSVIGDVDKFVFAQFGDLTDYNGASFRVMRDMGFKYFIASGSQPWAEVRTDYVRQKRLTVTGNALGWHQSEYEGIFDCNAVVDMATRVSIPN